MLEHQKIVLQNVSHDKELFRKELKKSIIWLQSFEVYQLYSWAKNKFGNIHGDIIKEVFALMAA